MNDTNQYCKPIYKEWYCWQFMGEEISDTGLRGVHIPPWLAQIALTEHLCTYPGYMLYTTPEVQIRIEPNEWLVGAPCKDKDGRKYFELTVLSDEAFRENYLLCAPTVKAV